ncbi:MAG: response regulator [Bacteroidota bacterium]|nr:response regulator [Bacteroidota bacterium]
MKEPANNISEMLRDVDKVVKSGNLEEAIILIEKILEINPKNIYARAYNERVSLLLKEQKEKKEKEVSSAAQSSQIQPPEQKVSVPPIEQESKKPSAEHSIKLSDAILQAYKTLLDEVWRDGHITPVEQERIDAMRSFFAVSKDEHDYLEQNARMTCYLGAIKNDWNKGIREFTGVKKQFQLTDDEESILQPKVERLLKSLNSKGVILALDDDKNFLMIVGLLLEKNGYHTLNTTSGEEALTLLENFSPDLILCDIAFGSQNMNGFMFYEKFRAMERFASTPFIFISGLNQKEMLRTGKKLGVDDYLIKPFDNELLLATIEGRLRRVKEMQRTIDI